MFQTKYAAYYRLFNSKKPYKKEIDFLYKWAGCPRSILDIGCGTADYWQFFPSSVKVHGIEKSKDMIDVSPYYQRIIKADVNVMKLNILSEYECVTALFDVLNYTNKLSWIKLLPLKKHKFFIFDVWDYEKIKKDGFQRTEFESEDVRRTIIPKKKVGKTIELNIIVKDSVGETSETHKMYLWTLSDILKACSGYDLVETIETERWQRWYKLRKK